MCRRAPAPEREGIIAGPTAGRWQWFTVGPPPPGGGDGRRTEEGCRTPDLLRAAHGGGRAASPYTCGCRSWRHEFGGATSRSPVTPARTMPKQLGPLRRAKVPADRETAGPLPLSLKVVPGEGFEPSRVSPLDFESSASAVPPPRRRLDRSIQPEFHATQTARPFPRRRSGIRYRSAGRRHPPRCTAGALSRERPTRWAHSAGRPTTRR